MPRHSCAQVAASRPCYFRLFAYAHFDSRPDASQGGFDFRKCRGLSGTKARRFFMPASLGIPAEILRPFGAQDDSILSSRACRLPSAKRRAGKRGDLNAKELRLLRTPPSGDLTQLARKTFDPRPYAGCTLSVDSLMQSTKECLRLSPM